MRERIRNYFKNGIKDNQRRKDVYQFDYNEKFLNHYNTISEAKDVLNICINTLSDAIDKNYTMNNFIFRSRNVIFSETELNEIKKYSISKSQILRIIKK